VSAPPGSRRRAPSTLRALLDLRRPPRREAYGDHRSQRAELHLPDGPGPYPVVVVLHGGFWRARRSLRYMRPICADLARNGWAAWNVEYRRVGRSDGGGWPATFADVGAGIDHLATLDARLDLNRVAALGHSAGGHLALWGAARPSLPDGAPGAAPRVRITAGVAGLAAASDLEATPDLYAPGGAVLDLMGCTPTSAPDDRYALANPIRRLPLGVPVLLIHGDADETVPPRRSRDFAAAARAAGDQVTLIEPSGKGHRTAIDPRGAAFGEAVSWLGGLRARSPAPPPAAG
jgi:acetyl esterase/lipase